MTLESLSVTCLLFSLRPNSGKETTAFSIILKTITDTINLQDRLPLFWYYLTLLSNCERKMIPVEYGVVIPCRHFHST